MIVPPRPVLVTGLLLILPLAAVACSTYLLYQSALSEERARLQDLVRNQAALIEVVAALELGKAANADDRQSSSPTLATLRQVREGLARSGGIGQSGELVIGSAHGERLIIEAASQGTASDFLTEVRDPRRSQALQWALDGEAGARVTFDYDGTRVLAAFLPLQGLNAGLVAKIPMAEIQAPFLRSGLIGSGLGLILGMVGAVVYWKQTSPMQQRLRRQQREYNILLANLPGMVFRCRNDPNWTMEFVSSGVREMAGFDPDDLRLSEKYAFGTLIHEDDRQPVWDAVQAGIAEDTGYEVRYRLYDVHGAIRHVWERGRPVHDAEDGEVRIEGFITDVTQATEAAETQKRLADIVHSTSDFVAIVDAEGHPLYVNPAGHQLVGSASLRDSLFAYTPASFAERLREQVLPHADRHGHWEGEMALLHEDGSEIPVSGVVLAHRDSSEATTYYSAVYRNLSAQKDYEERLQQERNFNRALVDYLPGWFYLVDEQRRFARWNQNMEVVMGMSSRDIAAHELSELIHPEDRPLAESRMREVFADGAAKAEARIQPRSGAPVPYHFEARRVVLDDRVYLLGFGTDISDRKAQEAEISRLSFRDPLTDLANRALLLIRLSEEIARCRRHGLVGGLMLFDLDDFKPVNDSLGHPVGDEVLKALAERISDQIRTEDTLARIGGDEFVILLPHMAEDTESAGLTAQNTAERLHAMLDAPIVTAEITLHLSASIGITVFPVEPNDEPNEILRRADAAMYDAKQSGKGAIRFYRPEIRTAIHERLTLEQELRRGFQAGELSVHYQPIVNLDSGRTCGAEALVRWEHPGRGFISPGEFIPVAEQSGFVVPLGNWVLHQALAQGRIWREQGRLSDECRLSINISPRQFALPGFADTVRAAIEGAGFPANMVTLEITETILWEDPSVPEKMAELNRLGIRFAVDDFGTGYSSLFHLKRLPINTLKIDKSFIQDMEWNSQSRTITETLLLMARKLNLDTVAEGVEKSEQIQFVQEHGCTMAQGFFYGKPVPPQDFPEYSGSE